MKWPKGTTIWPAFAGTSETLSATLPTAVRRQRSSLTISTSCWSFLTQKAMESFLEDRKAMTQHAEMLPKTRTHLWMRFHVEQEMFEVWEVVDKLPPSAPLELEPDRSPDLPESRATKSPCDAGQQVLPALVMEISADGTEVVAWPGPEVTPG